jgi:hypothetical protein
MMNDNRSLLGNHLKLGQLLLAAEFFRQCALHGSGCVVDVSIAIHRCDPPFVVRTSATPSKGVNPPVPEQTGKGGFHDPLDNLDN